MLRLHLSTFWMLTLAALPAGAAQTQSSCDAGPPHLEHSAPWVGGSLELALDGAAPGASVRLFHSPSGASSQTPFGLLELDRTQLGLAAGGLADAQGHWAVALAIPLDASLVEVEGHYQALVQDPAGTAMLSSAVHLRYLGPRSYTLCAGDGSAPPSLDVHAIATGTPVASVPLGPWPPASCPTEALWRPAFSANLARCAFLSGCGELVVIDNFACTVVAVLPVESAVPRLLPSGDGRLAYVLERPGSGAPPRIRALELASASFVATLDLPATCGPLWDLDEAAQTAFVQDVHPASGEHLARRVDLAGWQVLDVLRLRLPPGSSLDWLEVQQGWLHAGSRWIGSLTGNALAAVDLDLPGASPIVVSFGPHHPRPPAVVPAAARLFVGVGNGIGPSSDQVYVAPLDLPQRLVADLGAPTFPPFTFGPSVARDDHLWILTEPWDTDHAAKLWNLDALALLWVDTADAWAYPWPATLLAARGPLADVLLMPRSGSLTGPATFAPAVLVLDPDSGAITGSWPLSWGALAGYVLEPE